MKKVSIVNIKGGVGKTVSTVNIAACLGELNKKVLIVDADAQSNATQYLNCYSPEGISTYDVLMDKDIDVNTVIKNTSVKGVSVIPANIKLILCENEIVNDTRRSRENRLKKALDALKEEYDYVIIDCPPSLGVVTTNALVASDYILVPIKIDRFALDGFGYLLDTIDQISDEFNPKLNFTGAFITMDKRTAINRKMKAELKEALKDKLFNVSIRENVKVIQSTFEQQPVITYCKNAISSKDYRALTQEVMKHVI
ncbi:ParA family protein [Clostridium sp. AWRP]|uniref:ParA family protein n=1 Tax=Clostridium sp. AWRP TaxID=2212991 RepID=UPI000FD9650B|nr:ParA family protein [Clostridium sp. AWRP]AZV56776.1 ParA family protein [Clostridium sp. AWRP]